MPFETLDLDDREIAQLAVEYVRASGRWFEEAADPDQVGHEVARILRELAETTRGFGGELAARVDDHFGDTAASSQLLSHRTRRPAWLLDQGTTDFTAEEILEVAISDLEEHYQFFLGLENESDEAWMQGLFRELAQLTRRLLVLLEEEREGLIDAGG